MKILTLIRHAKSSWKDSNLSDRQRPLNKRGERDAPVMGKRIAEHGIRPSLIICSPAARARSTAKIIAREISYPIEFLQREDGLYLASLDDFLGRTGCAGQRIQFDNGCWPQSGHDRLRELFITRPDAQSANCRRRFRTNRSGPLESLRATDDHAPRTRLSEETCLITGLQHSGTLTANPPFDVSL